MDPAFVEQIQDDDEGPDGPSFECMLRLLVPMKCTIVRIDTLWRVRFHVKHYIATFADNSRIDAVGVRIGCGASSRAVDGW
ncbi:MAG TPA: hypothetical protein VMU33_02960 [Burkholderiaceae bacterium]|nr:hypothetical protein [Burkholderiaceae bacterium]